MTVVVGERMTVPAGTRVGGGDQRIDDADDVVAKYLDRWVDPNGRTVPSGDDPSSMGLVLAMWSAMFAMTESAALWWAWSPRRSAELGGWGQPF